MPTIKAGRTLKKRAVSATLIAMHHGGSSGESNEEVRQNALAYFNTQNRAVTSRDYESIIKTIYPDTESVAVVGGEELDPPEFGTVQISIKPKNGFSIFWGFPGTWGYPRGGFGLVESEFWIKNIEKQPPEAKT